MRLFQKCRERVTNKPAPKPRVDVDFNDRLADIYFTTLCRRLISDTLTAIVLLVVISVLSVSTGFCRSTVSVCV